MPQYILKGSKSTKEVDMFKFGHILNGIVSDNFDIFPAAIVKKMNNLADHMIFEVQSEVPGINIVIQTLKQVLREVNNEEI